MTKMLLPTFLQLNVLDNKREHIKSLSHVDQSGETVPKLHNISGLK
jgi:hypothetical protein